MNVYSINVMKANFVQKTWKKSLIILQLFPCSRRLFHENIKNYITWKLKNYSHFSA